MTKIGFVFNDDLQKSMRKKSVFIEEAESPMHNPEVNYFFLCNVVYYRASPKISVTLLRISF